MPIQNSISRGMTSEFAARYLLADVTEVAEETRKRHGLLKGAGRLSAEAVAASALLSSQIKGEERLTVQLQAEDPRLAFLCDIRADGYMRARLQPFNAKRKPGGAIDGIFLVIKHNAQKELYRGITELSSLPIDKGLQTHLTESSQVDTVVRIAVQHSSNGEIRRAVGLLVERLPKAPDLPYLDREAFFSRYSELHSCKAKELMKELESGKLLGSKLHQMEQRDVRWQCRCSKSRITSMLFSLGAKEMQGIFDELGQAEVTCDFCGQPYIVDGEELRKLIGQHST
jgi:molecular chaperone Hsp33